MVTNRLDVIIVGAGHAGLSASYLLKQKGIEHLVFERGRIGESWLSQRWTSFRLNTPNHMNKLPGQPVTDQELNDFASASQFANSLREYACQHMLPVGEHISVTRISKKDGESLFKIQVREHGLEKTYWSAQVIICSGGHSSKTIPSFAKAIDPGVYQLHAGDYRNVSQLPDGTILVVGSAQSGCQIAEDLLDQGRKVFLSTSMVARIPRRYRGRDIIDWLDSLGFFDLKTDAVTDPRMFHMKAPQISGTGNGGHTVSLQSLAAKGAVIVGKMDSVKGTNIQFAPNAKEHILFADEFSQKVKLMIDEYIFKNNLDTSPPENDPADIPDLNGASVSPISELDMANQNIRSIIWSTGFGMDMSYIDLPVLDKNGCPIHQQGLSGIEGLYFLGLPWLRSRKSGVIAGIQADAEFICEQVSEFAQKRIAQQHRGRFTGRGVDDFFTKR